MSSVMYNRHKTVRMIHCSSLILMSLEGNLCLHESSLIITYTRTQKHTELEHGGSNSSKYILYWRNWDSVLWMMEDETNDN